MVPPDRKDIPGAERPEISVRVLADEIARCQDTLKRELLIADFLSKLRILPADSNFWNLANLILSNPERVKPIMEQMMNVEVLVITVRKEEITSIIETFPDEQSPEITSVQPLKLNNEETWFRGRFSFGARTVDVILAYLTETGQTDSSHITTHFIHRIEAITGGKPNFAVLVGICAGSRRRPSIHFGDVVVPPHIFDESIYKVTRVKGRKKIFPETRQPGKPHETLLRLCKAISLEKSFWNTPKLQPVDDHKFPPDVHLDPAFTGNFFNEDPEYLKKCQDLYNRKTIAYEMEAGGFARACHGEDVPFVVIRGMSDWGDEDASNDSWRSYAARTASVFMYELFKVASIPSR